MTDINKQQQAAIAAHQNIQQQQPSDQQAQMQQQVDGQTIQVQQVQIAHDGNDQLHSQNSQVVTSSSNMSQASTMVMAASQQALIPQQAIQNMQSPSAITPIHPQAGSTTVTTMSTGPHQQMTEWPGHSRVQVIQQPLQNPTYIQPVYNAQGQLIVPGNIALHPGNMNQPIQVITGKAFQPGQMSHMLTTAQGKPIVQGQTSFPGYATIPTSGSNQTLVISQLGVLGQTNIVSQQQGKPQEMQKMVTKSNINGSTIKASPTQQQNVSIGNLANTQQPGITSQPQAIIQPQIISPIQQRTLPQGATQTMQFAPWQATFGPTGLPQGLTWAPGTIQSSALLTQGSQIFIRNPQTEQTGMFIHNAQGSGIPQANQIANQQVNKQNQTIDMGGSVQSKTAIPKTFSAILPNSISPQQIRPVTGVSTQTGQTQTMVHQNNFQTMKTGTKVRAKSMCRMQTIATTQKVDVGHQAKAATSIQVLHPKLVVSNIVPGTPGSISQDNKLLKQTQNPNVQSQQPLTQIQQFQNIFNEQMDQKSQPGQIMVSSGDRTLMPVVSMPLGQVSSIMGNMIIQIVPGIPTMALGIYISANQSVQGVTQELIAKTNAVSIKPESAESKETRVQQNGRTDAGRGKSGNGNNSRSELSANSSAPDAKSKPQTRKEGDMKNKSNGNKETKNVDKKSNEKDPPKATMMVKPQVLTHVIEGFVIQESSEPFPVTRGSTGNSARKMAAVGKVGNGEPPKKKPSVEANGKEKETTKCQTCGKKDIKSKFKRSKKYCSMSCAKREKNELKKMNSEGETDAQGSNMGENTSSPPTEVVENPSSANQENENKVNPMQWTVEEVCEFIRTLPGCADYVEDFAMQDIDGEALMLLKPDHLMSVMSMKLGPAVKIIAKIDTIRNGETNPPA